MTQRSDFAFFHRLRVRWGECDAQNIVFNVNYFLYFDVGITEYFRALGFQGDKMLEFYTVNANSDFHGSAAFDEEIDVGVRCARIGTKSMTMAMAIFRGDELLNEGALTYVHAEPGTKTTTPLPEEFVNRVLDFENTAPERESIMTAPAIKKLNIKDAFDRIPEPWSPHIAGRINNQEVRLAKIDGPFEWHAHADADEAFFVVKGAFTMRFRDRDAEMGEGDFIVVPAGVEHMPDASDGECWIMMVENSGTVNTGDNVSDRTKTDLPEL